MDSQKQQLAERLKQANNVLVTVSNNPSVDQLAACIGLTLVLNHMDKHATAVFSGAVPSTIEFLKPEDTLEKNTDSLRDFIIALDKSKADKLRYKVEDKVVKIFITPYRTSISDKDLEFSQGDFNVDVVVALGVHEQQDLDQAITAHGRILHDATVATVNVTPNGGLGSLNWVDTGASSLSELVVQLTDLLDKKALDNQTATALLTGIVAATDRFSNDKTAPSTMSASAELMAAGANQQLIATKLEAPAPLPPTPQNRQASEDEKPRKEPGELDIDHNDEHVQPPAAPESKPEPDEPQVRIDEHGQLTTAGPEEKLPKISGVHGVSSEEGDRKDSTAVPGEEPDNTIVSEKPHERMTEPPEMGGQLTANTTEEGLDEPTEELTLPAVDTPLLSHDAPSASAPPPAVIEPEPAPAQPAMSYEPAPTEPAPPQPAAPGEPTPPPTEPTPEPQGPPAITPDETLAEIEKSVDSPHAKLEESDTTAPNADDARRAVEAALNSGVQSLETPAAFNSLPLSENLHNEAAAPSNQPMVPVNPGFSEPTPGNSPADDTLDMPLPSSPPALPSAFPGAPAPGGEQKGGSDTLPPPPPVAPPPIIPG